MENRISDLEKNCVTRDRLEAEIARAELRAFRQGREDGYRKGAFVFGCIGAVCTLLTTCGAIVASIAAVC